MVKAESQVPVSFSWSLLGRNGSGIDRCTRTDAGVAATLGP